MKKEWKIYAKPVDMSQSWTYLGTAGNLTLQIKKEGPAGHDLATARLKKCFDAGSVEGLFPLLFGWTKKELRTLLKDVEAYHFEGLRRVELKSKKFSEKYKGKPSCLAALKLAQDTVRFRLLGVCSEICSVAQYYLKIRKPRKVKKITKKKR